jgi:Holliday junction resolvase
VSESQLGRAIIDAINITGLGVAWRCQSGMVKVRGAFMHLAPEGTPDVIGYLNDGRMLAIEVKLPKEKPSQRQVDWLERAHRRGVVCGIARSVDEAIAIVRGT